MLAVPFGDHMVYPSQPHSLRPSGTFYEDHTR